MKSGFEKAIDNHINATGQADQIKALRVAVRCLLALHDREGASAASQSAIAQGEHALEMSGGFRP